MSNLIFRGQIASEGGIDDRLVIDTSGRLDEYMEKYRSFQEKRQEAIKEQMIDEFLGSLEEDEEGMPIVPQDEDGNYLIPDGPDGTPLFYVWRNGEFHEAEEEIPPEESEGEEEEAPEEPQIDREAIQREIDAMLEEGQKQVEAMIADAQAQADGIVEAANAEAEDIREKAREEGSSQGFTEGTQRAMTEAEERKRQAEEEFAAMRAEIKKEEEALEEQLVDVICGIVEEVFAIEFGQKKEIIHHLADAVITNTPTSKIFLIRVNETNYAVLEEKRGELMEKIGKGVDLDIVKDPLLTDEQCQIETDGGVFDCGMDVVLKELMNDIRALSIL